MLQEGNSDVAPGADSITPPPMPTQNDSHDTLARRLVLILSKLNQGETLSPQRLAGEFNVNLRTIQRDLNQRFDFLELERDDNGHYHLPLARLGQLGLEDIKNFASLAGVHGLFPALNTDFLKDILANRLRTALLVKGPQYEALAPEQRADFDRLEQAILQRNPITFDYHKPEGRKTYTDAHPYKLVNHDGIWYLAAKDGDRLKSFTFVKMDRLQVAASRYTPDPVAEHTLAAEDDIWLNAQKQEVILKIAKDAASYFERRKLVSSQQIVRKLEDGSLIVSTKIAHPNQILPTVRQWIPHIRIISPEGLQVEMERELKNYLSPSSST